MRLRFGLLNVLLTGLLLNAGVSVAPADVGVGAKPLAGAEVILDGSRAMLDAKWM